MSHGDCPNHTQSHAPYLWMVKRGREDDSRETPRCLEDQGQAQGKHGYFRRPNGHALAFHTACGVQIIDFLGPLTKHCSIEIRQSFRPPTFLLSSFRNGRFKAHACTL